MNTQAQGLASGRFVEASCTAHSFVDVGGFIGSGEGTGEGAVTRHGGLHIQVHPLPGLPRVGTSSGRPRPPPNLPHRSLRALRIRCWGGYRVWKAQGKAPWRAIMAHTSRCILSLESRASGPVAVVLGRRLTSPCAP